MHAYDEKYIDEAMENLGEAVDYANECLGICPSDFFTYFVMCGIAHQFGCGHPKYVVGMSGTEMAQDIAGRIYNYGNEHIYPQAQIAYDYSAEYWCGWIMAYYQWYCGYSFSHIIDRINIDELLLAYSPLHEASEDRAVRWFDSRIGTASVNELQRKRRLLGYTQKLLAEKSGVNLRTLQQYETGAKDIHKASGNTLLALSSCLGCSIEELIS